MGEEISHAVARTSEERAAGRVRASFVRPIRWLFNTLALLMGDWTALALALVVSQLARLALQAGGIRVPLWVLMVAGLWPIAAILGRVLPGWGLGVIRELQRIFWLLPITVGMVVIAVALAGRRADITRLELLVMVAAAMPLVPYIRTKMKSLLIRLGVWGMPTVVHGDSAAVRSILKAISHEPGLGYAPVAIVATRDLPEGEEIEGIPVVAADDARVREAPAVIVAEPATGRGELLGALDGPLASHRHVLVIPDMGQSPSLWVEPRDLGGILGLEIAQNLSDPWARTFKHLFELTLVILTAPIWLPLTGLLAIIVRLVDRQSPFFRHERIGEDGKPFLMGKLRTMRIESESDLQQTLASDENAREQWETQLKLQHDPRVTRLGRVLRRWSLDELPQLINVLRGEMSLVGPRPLVEEEHLLVPNPARRLRESVRPGMTGLWQVSGRSDSGLEGMVYNDAYYVRNWSVWLDLVILVRSGRAILGGSGAY